MNWFIISIIPPMIWAATNYIDKYLLTRFFKGKGGGPLLLFTCFADLVLIIIIAILFSSQLSIGHTQMLTMILIGMLGMSGGLLYLFALSKDDPAVVIPLFQLIPVFNFLAGLIFLHERLATIQVVAGLLIIFGAIFISLDLSEGKPKLKKGILGVMILDCFLIGIGNLAFKAVASGSNFWGTMFWQGAGTVLFGLMIVVFLKNWRNEFAGVVKAGRLPVIGVTLISEFSNVGAVLVYNYALLIAPIAIVSVLGNGLQPFFILIFGGILGFFSLKSGKEIPALKHQIQRVAAIIIIFIGSYLLNR